MTLKFIELALLTLLLIASQAIAEKTDLLSIYQQALDNDAQFAAARAKFQADKEKENKALAKLLPEVKLSSKSKREKKVQLQNGISGRTNGGNIHEWRATLEQPVFNLKKWFTYTKSKIQVSKADREFSLEAQLLILRVAEAYFNSLRAEDSLTTAKAREAAFKRQYKQAQQRFEVGLVTKTDVLETKAEYDNTRMKRITAENEIEVSYEALRTITGQLPDELGTLDKNMPVKAPTPSNIDSWTKSIINNNLAVQIAEEAVKIAVENVKIAKAGHAPTIGFEAKYTHSRGLKDSLKNTNGKSNTITSDLTFKLPIFKGGKTSSEHRKASSLLAKAKRDKTFELRKAYQQTRNLFNTVNTDVKRVDATSQSITSSTWALEATKRSYEVGMRNISDVLDAQSKLYNSKQEYLYARYDFIINTLKLKQQAGTLSPEDLMKLNLWISKSDKM